ncbi:MAG TPA: hypothetical protein VGL77_19895, partial [Armatimonadota bacterium]
GAIELQADGAITQPDVTMGLTLAHAAYGQTSLPNLQATLASEHVDGQYALRIVNAVAENADGHGRASLSGRVVPGKRWDLRLAADKLTPTTFSPWLGPVPLDGEMTVAATIAGPWRTPIVAGDIQIAHPTIASYSFAQANAHVNLTRDRLSLSDGKLWLTAESQPLTLQGAVPLKFAGLHADIPRDGVIAFTAKLPKQSLSALRSMLPGHPTLDGTVEGALRVGGTVAAPRIAEAHVTLDGSAQLALRDAGYPNTVNGIVLDLQAATDSQGQTRVTLANLAASFDRRAQGQRVAGFQPGAINAEGTITIAPRQLLQPNQWQWDIYGQAADLPLAQQDFLVPRVSGYVHVGSGQNVPAITGVIFADDAKITAPELSTPVASQWGPLDFNPTLSLVLQAGEHLKLAKGIVRLPLQATPLPWPEPIATSPGAPMPDVPHTAAVFAYNATMLNPGTAAELPGSWGVLTGTLENPLLYARFEVNKHKLAFPFSIIGSARNARGHVTYNMADGPQITMGIPDFPVSKVASADARVHAEAPTLP